MKFYTSANGKTITRASALSLLALCTVEGTPIPDEVKNHGNYHVRRAYWVSQGMPIPEGGDEKARLFKTVMPNAFNKVVEQKAKDTWQIAKNTGLIKWAEEHNAKAAILLSAEPEKFEVLSAWLPIVQHELCNLAASTDAEAIDEMAFSCAEVDTWLQKRCQKNVPEAFLPIAAGDSDKWCKVVGESMYAQFFVSDRETIAAIEASK